MVWASVRVLRRRELLVILWLLQGFYGGLASNGAGQWPSDPPTLASDGNYFKFSVEVMTPYNYITGSWKPILQGAVGALYFHLGGTYSGGYLHRLRVGIQTRTGSWVFFFSDNQLNLSTWTLVTVTKSSKRLCIEFDNVVTCKNFTPGDSQMKNARNLEWGGGSKLSARNYQQLFSTITSTTRTETTTATTGTTSTATTVTLTGTTVTTTATSTRTSTTATATKTSTSYTRTSTSTTGTFTSTTRTSTHTNATSTSTTATSTSTTRTSTTATSTFTTVTSTRTTRTLTHTTVTATHTTTRTSTTASLAKVTSRPRTTAFPASLGSSSTFRQTSTALPSTSVAATRASTSQSPSTSTSQRRTTTSMPGGSSTGSFLVAREAARTMTSSTPPSSLAVTSKATSTSSLVAEPMTEVETSTSTMSTFPRTTFLRGTTTKEETTQPSAGNFDSLLASVAPQPDPAWLVLHKNQSAGLLEDLVHNASLETSSAGNVSSKTVAVRLPSTSAPFRARVPNSNATVLLPLMEVGALDGEELACVATEFTGETIDQESASVVRGAMKVEVWSLSKMKRKRLNRLKVPIFISLPVLDSAEVDCAYWHEDMRSWFTDGVTTRRDLSSAHVLVCATTHLTLFAAVWRGMEQSVVCAQVRLLSSEGLRELFESDDWVARPAAVIYWVLLVILAFMFLGAFVLDAMRSWQRAWSDEYFLVPTDGRRVKKEETLEEANREVDTPQTYASYESGRSSISLWSSSGSPAPSPFSSARLSMLSTLSTRAMSPTPQDVRSAVVVPFLWCKKSSALRDALDDVASRWFDHFSEVRDFVEGIWDGIGLEHDSEEHGSRFARMAYVAMGSFVACSARRQAGASLGLSNEVVDFIIRDEDLSDILLQAAILKHTGPSEEKKDAKAIFEERRLQAWQDLHKKVIERIDYYWHLSEDWGHLPRVASRLFVVNNPFASVFLSNQFWSSSMRVLFFTCELFGSMMVASVFFQSTAGAKGKRGRGNCGNITGGAMWIGRLFVIGLGSLVIAGIPVIILSSLHNRSFKKFPSRECPQWKKQLRVWWIQDVAVWTLGLTYIGFCAFFVALFLANVSPRDHLSWGISAVISVAEDTLVTPMAVSIMLPFCATACLSLVSWIRGEARGHLLSRRRSELEKNGNWGSIVLSI